MAVSDILRNYYSGFTKAKAQMWLLDDNDLAKEIGRLQEEYGGMEVRMNNSTVPNLSSSNIGLGDASTTGGRTWRAYSTPAAAEEETGLDE